jgi:hypothetical protein
MLLMQVISIDEVGLLDMIYWEQSDIKLQFQLKGILKCKDFM